MKQKYKSLVWYNLGGIAGACMVRFHWSLWMVVLVWGIAGLLTAATSRD